MSPKFQTIIDFCKKNWKQTILAAFAVIICLVAAFFVISRIPSNSSTVNSQEDIKTKEIKKIEFKTNGVINSKFISKFLKLKSGTSLYSVDVFEIKKNLESIKQIRHALVTRKFPDTLSITINERTPILKIAARDGEKKKIFLIDEEDGEIFESECYSNEKLKDLFFAEINLPKNKEIGQTFEPIDKIFIITNFLKIIQLKHNKLYSQITSVSLKRYDPRPGALWSRIELKTKIVKTIVFSDSNFADQLEKLDYILSDPNIIKLLPLKKIDLSNPNNVVINN